MIGLTDQVRRRLIPGLTDAQAAALWGEPDGTMRVAADDLPCDSEPHGEDAGVAVANTLELRNTVQATVPQTVWTAWGERVRFDDRFGGAGTEDAGVRIVHAAGTAILRNDDGAPWSPGQGVHPLYVRQIEERAEIAVREFCAAFGIPVPDDMKRASAAILALQFNRGT